MASWKKPFRILNSSRNQLTTSSYFHGALRAAARQVKGRHTYTAIVVSPRGKTLATCSSGEREIHRGRTRDSSGRTVKIREAGAARRHIAACSLTPAGRQMLKRRKRRK